MGTREQQKALRAIERMDKAVGRAERKTISYKGMTIDAASLIPVASDEASGACMYLVPSDGTGGLYCMLFATKREPAWGSSISALRSALAELARNERIPGAGLLVAVKMPGVRADGSEGGTWRMGTLVDIEHPALARHSRYYHRQQARVLFQGEKTPTEVDYAHVRVCDSSATLNALESVRTKLRALEAEKKRLDAVLVTVWAAQRKLAKPGEDEAPLTAKTIQRIARSQRSRIASRRLR